MIWSRIPEPHCLATAPRRVYIAGASLGGAGHDVRAILAAFDALTSAGHHVVAPGALRLPRPDTADLLADVGDDLGALMHADVVVAMPGSEDLWELAYAAAVGVPVVRLADLMPAQQLAA